MERIRNLHPVWIATAIVVLVVVWLASGMLAEDDKQTGDGAAEPAESEPVKVQVRTSKAEQITREAVVNGRTAPVRSVTVRAETTGRVAEVVAERGARLDKNDIIVRLTMDDRRAQLAEAKATREQRRLQYQAAKRMQSQGYQTDVDLAQARANLESARAQVEQIQEDIDETVIRAPFAGVLETRPVEEGDVIATGDEIGRLIDQSPFIVRGNVSEDVIGYLESGQTGTARLVNGKVRKGTLRYIASDADEATRTYRVELEIPNPEGRLISGASAEMRLPLEKVMAHEIEPAIMTLNAAGEFGIKSVADNDTVRFNRADIVRNRNGKVWLTGLPQSLRIISVGQGFVTAGDNVEPVHENGEDDQTAPAEIDVPEAHS